MGDFVWTRSSTKEAYASRPSASHPIGGNNLKKRVVKVESRASKSASARNRVVGAVEGLRLPSEIVTTEPLLLLEADVSSSSGEL